MSEPWFVYVLRCADGTLYTGLTNDVARRVDLHNQGRGARYTRGRLPVELVYIEEAGSRADATRREAAVKRMSRAAKMRLVGQPVEVAGAARPRPERSQRD